MILYNVTINITPEIHDRWLLWMNEVHIPEILATGLFTMARLVRVHADQPIDGITYAAQYTATQKEQLESYYRDHAPRLREQGLRLWGDNALYFRTELEVIADHWPQS